jgi:hypothetical protein
MRRGAMLLILGVAVAVLGSGGVIGIGEAQVVPNESQVIWGCYKTYEGTALGGQLRIVGAANWCKADEFPISWYAGANPSWNQKLPCTTKTNCPRFVVLSDWNNKAVLDRETGLIWEKSPSTSVFKWEHAQSHCNKLKTGGRLGWRLPTLQELASLVDTTQANPALPAGHPFTNVQLFFYWSATSLANDRSAAWEVVFDDGSLTSDDKRLESNFWCVRGGQGVNPQ